MPSSPPLSKLFKRLKRLPENTHAEAQGRKGEIQFADVSAPLRLCVSISLHSMSRIVKRNIGGSSRGNAESEAIMSLLWELVAVNGKNSTSTKTPTETTRGTVSVSLRDDLPQHDLRIRARFVVQQLLDFPNKLAVELGFQTASSGPGKRILPAKRALVFRDRFQEQ